jgi:hypothetical protein
MSTDFQISVNQAGRWFILYLGQRHFYFRPYYRLPAIHFRLPTSQEVLTRLHGSLSNHRARCYYRAVQELATARDAKEFLVSRIVEESQREGVPLSEVERKMMYFSETGWTLPDISEVNETFDRDYDQGEYEQKIGKLVRNLCADARGNSREQFDAWTAAVKILRREDHYLLVLIDAGQPSSFSPRRLLKLMAVAVAIAAVVLVVGYFVISR